MLKENAWLALCSQVSVYYLPGVQAKNLGITLNSTFPNIPYPVLQNQITYYYFHGYNSSAGHLPSNQTTSAVTLLENVLKKETIQPVLVKHMSDYITPLLILFGGVR